jgi:8-oxo-dGTP pyrophosphatase MutT (NUDIX family)
MSTLPQPQGRSGNSAREAASACNAAVLVPVFTAPGGGLRLVLVRKTLHGAHGGQLAFPGGRRQTGDATLIETALREAEEETGIDPAGVQILRALPEVVTLATGCRIAPFLGRIRRPAAWSLDEREIAEVIEVELASLLAPEATREEVWQLEHWPEPRRVRFIAIGQHKLWGASYQILRPLLPGLAALETDAPA